MIHRVKIGRHTFGVALGRREGTANPANRNASRIIRVESLHGPTHGSLTTRSFRYGRAWHHEAAAPKEDR